MTGMRSVLYEFDWQKIRVQCLRKHNFKGGWTTKEGVEHNLKSLDQYLMWSEMSGTEESLRTYRVVNLLNATRMGYSGQRWGASQDEKDLINSLDDLVCEFRDETQNSPRYNRQAVVDAGFNWDWNEVVEGVRKGLENDPGWFDAIYADLTRRVGKKTDIKATRDELHRFIAIMEAVTDKWMKSLS